VRVKAAVPVVPGLVASLTGGDDAAWCDARALPRIAVGLEPPYGAAMRRIAGEAAAQGIASGPQTIAFKSAARDAYCPGGDLT
jgi:hypothetical protein